jgi:sugar phosphate isomerase/epimerase
VHIAASTRSLPDLAFPAACLQLQDLGFDKVEISLSESGEQLRPAHVAADAEGVAAQVREASRLTPIAVCLEDNVDIDTFTGIVTFAKLLKIAQITIQASPRGTPFNTEVDRLRERNQLCHHAGIRLSILTRNGLLSDDPHTAVELCQSAPGLGITLDPSHFICRPGGSVDFDVVFPSVLHVHLRDSTANELQVPAGLGEVDYNRIIAMLLQENYQRALSVDLLPGGLQGEERLLELRKLRLLLESLL